MAYVITIDDNMMLNKESKRQILFRFADSMTSDQWSALSQLLDARYPYTYAEKIKLLKRLKLQDAIVKR